MIHNSKFIIRNSKKGFTLIEILVVISIIGILATLILARLGGVEKSGRDAKRKSDLNQYRMALENYATKLNGLYPNNTYNGQASSGNGIFNTGGILSTYLGAFPKDPLNNAAANYDYYYVGAADQLKYVLYGKLETETTNFYYYLCSTGKIDKSSSAPTIAANCP